MTWQQLSLFDNHEEEEKRVFPGSESDVLQIVISALAAEVISLAPSELASLANDSDAVAIARSLGNLHLVRQLKVAQGNDETRTGNPLRLKENIVYYREQAIGTLEMLFKSPLPGELQARLAIDSASDRFMEYLQKHHKIAILAESDFHFWVFIPGKTQGLDITKLWQIFLTDVAFSAYGDTQNQLPGLVQTFIQVLNSITLSGRGFSTLELPILTQEQATVLAAWYRAVIRDVEKRQKERQKQIDGLKKQIKDREGKGEDSKSSQNELDKKEAMQNKEAKKYCEYFQKGFGKLLEGQQAAFQELDAVQSQLAQAGLSKAQQRKLLKQQEKLTAKIAFSREWVREKSSLFQRSQGNPFDFFRLDREQNYGKFKKIEELAKAFSKTATDQINSTRGDIFTQCVVEMYRLLEIKPEEMDSLPTPLLSEKPAMRAVRSPGDDSKEFCYSCGVEIDPKTARWQVLRFMFERPSQRRQSASSEGRPHICASCAVLAFASPLKVTDESIILQLKTPETEKRKDFAARQQKLKDYMRMLTNKQLHLSAGRYLVLASDRTAKGEVAAQKLGQVQYALAKVASIFPREVLTDLEFSLITQGSQPIRLASRHLIFIKGLMEAYSQSIVVSDKEINMQLGDAVRYVERDLPVMAEYKLAKFASLEQRREMEKTRETYANKIQQDVQGFSMSANNQLLKRATLYKDVAALTGLTYAFVQSLERTARNSMKPEDVEREVGKIIEQVDDAVAFCYYATLGDENKTRVRARLYRNSDNYFIYEQTSRLLEELGISNREQTDESQQQTWLMLCADDVMKAYTHFAENCYTQEKEWKELTYQLKLYLYTRFPELVRKLKSTTEKK